eukprot:154796-Rhodomonas_salina.1
MLAATCRYCIEHAGSPHGRYSIKVQAYCYIDFNQVSSMQAATYRYCIEHAGSQHGRYSIEVQAYSYIDFNQ